MTSEPAVVAYCRVPTYEQNRRGHGIEIQIRDVTLFAERQGLFVHRFYKDEGESGVKEKRTALRRLLRDCRAGRVRTVIIPSPDRLSRDVRLAENLFHEFEHVGVRILIADMPTYNAGDRKDVLIRQIREAIAEENRKDIIERLWKGRQARVRGGLPPGGNVAYGYRRQGRSWIREPGEVEVVTLVFRLSQLHLSPGAIARTLNDKGLTRRNGQPSTRRQVATVLSSGDLYRTGVLSYGAVRGQNKALGKALPGGQSSLTRAVRRAAGALREAQPSSADARHRAVRRRLSRWRLRRRFGTSSRAA